MRRLLPSWPPRDWRMLLALGFLAGGGVAMTVLAWRTQSTIAFEPWPDRVAELRIRWLAYLGLAALTLVGITLTSFGFVLGRRAWKVKAGMFDASAEGGEESASGPAGAMGGPTP